MKVIRAIIHDHDLVLEEDLVVDREVAQGGETVRLAQLRNLDELAVDQIGRDIADL